MNSINIDPRGNLESNLNTDDKINEAIEYFSKKSSTIGSNVLGTTGSMYGIQNMMQMQLMNTVMNNLKFIRTGDPMMDTVLSTLVQGLIIGFIGLLMTQFSNLLAFFSRKFNNGYNLGGFYVGKGYNYIRHKLCKGRKKYRRQVEIPYISDTKQINELYKGVYWYLTNNMEINYLHEPFLQYVFDKKISVDNKDEIKNNMSINKILQQQKTKEINFKNHEITYSLKTDLITVYTDKDRKRENYIVTLWTDVDEVEKTDVLEEFCQHCLTEYVNNLSSTTWKQLIYTNNGSEWKGVPSNNNRKLDTIILKNGLINEIKNDLQLFLNSEEWYKERDIPYTRGYLFYGYPGTGKTSMIKGISMYCKRHIHFLMLSEVKSDGELLELLKKINYKDTILVIEDIDAMGEIVKSREEKEENVSPKSNSSDPKSSSNNLQDKLQDKLVDGLLDALASKDKKEEKEENKKLKSQLTLSGLLNAIDGVFSCHGRILIMTTNHPEVLDSALIRPGRVDSKYLFDNCNKDQIK